MSDASLSDASRSHVLMSRYLQTYLPTLPTYSTLLAGIQGHETVMRMIDHGYHESWWRQLVPCLVPMSIHTAASPPMPARRPRWAQQVGGGKKRKVQLAWKTGEMRCLYRIACRAKAERQI
jgi:hypothetical protein